MIPLLPPAIIQAPDAKAFQAKCAEYSKAKDWKGLEAFARAFIETQPKNASAFAALGYALFAEGRDADGKAACEQAISLDPKCREAYLYLGMHFAALGDRARILEWGRKLDAAIPGAEADYFSHAPAIFCAVGEDPRIPCVDFEHIKLLNMPPMPPYPEYAKAAGIQGSVCIEAILGVDGIPISTRALSGPLSLRAYCEKYCLQYRFKPYEVDGHPSQVRFPIKMVLRLDYSPMPH